jgi:hypothetical protein
MRPRRLPAVAALAVPLALGACAGFPGFPETSTMVIVNKTTVPVSAEDGGSRRIVVPCSERTIEYHGTWGGDPESEQPVAEPLPADAYVVSLESQFTRPFETAIHLSTIVDATHGAHSLDSMPELRSEPCAGVPPAPSASTSPGPSR